METVARGKTFVLGKNIDTDQIYPGIYVEITDVDEVKKHALAGYDPEFVNKFKQGNIIVAGTNFGCGSSREHAPWALEVNGINVVLAENFARIFRQNMFNCGMLAIELPKETIDSLFKKYSGRETIIEVDLKKDKLYVSAGDDSEVIDFTISGFDKTLVQEGGWVEYADKRY